MYKPGDKVIYGNDGVCEVVAISQRAFPGRAGTRPYYTLKPVYQDYCIYSPVEGGRVFMRGVITREEANRLIDEIPTYEARAPLSRLRKDAVAHYQQSINSHDCRQLFEMTMGIYEKRQSALDAKRTFGALDEQFMKRAEELLFGELSVALGIARDQVQDYIGKRLQAGGEPRPC